jgi:hypothetical protein
MDCDECQRLAAEEAQATIELVNADIDLKGREDWVARKHRLDEAEKSLFEARRRLETPTSRRMYELDPRIAKTPLLTPASPLSSGALPAPRAERIEQSSPKLSEFRAVSHELLWPVRRSQTG